MGTVPAPVTRLLVLADAPALARLLAANRDHLERWEPRRDESFFTPQAQQAALTGALQEYRAGRCVPHGILDQHGLLCGRITLSGITRGAFQSASVGYWLAAAATGSGLATRAVHEIASLAFGPLGLHRLQAEIMTANDASRQVLLRNGFVRYGYAPRYLRIQDRWEDCELFQLLADEAPDD